jgi:hypothetical protein
VLIGNLVVSKFFSKKLFSSRKPMMIRISKLKRQSNY